MARLIYSAITSLDGYVEDARGGFEWAAPDAEVRGFVNELGDDVDHFLGDRQSGCRVAGVAGDPGCLGGEGIRQAGALDGRHASHPDHPWPRSISQEVAVTVSGSATWRDQAYTATIPGLSRSQTICLRLCTASPCSWWLKG